MSNESGRYEIYVRPFMASGPSGAPSLGEGKWQVSRDGGATPKWSADGKQVEYNNEVRDLLFTQPHVRLALARGYAQAVGKAKSGN